MCGRIGHIDRYYDLRFHISEVEIVLLWSEDLRAPSWRERQ
ncbi:hypothetical protein LINPERHAP1_LOCUS10636 [Linum perenne]